MASTNPYAEKTHLTVVISLPFVYVDITVQSNGFVRPNGEISVITAPMTETVERVSAKEGDKLRKGDEILRFRTSSPDELAHKLHISKRHLYNVLDDLRALGAKIDYSRSDYTFYYTNSFELHLNLQVEYLDDNDKKCIFAGSFYIMQCLCTEDSYLCKRKGIRKPIRT